MSRFDDDPEDVDCEAWLQPEIPLADLPRMAIDRQGLRAAAETIVRFEPLPVAHAAMRDGDPRLAPYLREAIARHKETALDRAAS